MAKFKDFSRFKHNEHRNYLFRKELERYQLEKEKNTKNKLTPYEAPLFSAVITIAVNSLVAFKIQETNGSIKGYYILLHGLTIAFLYILLVLVYKKGVYPMLSRLNEYIERQRLAKKPLDVNNFKSEEERADEVYISKFNHEVVDQIALAMSITSYLQENEESDAELENRFYVGEAYQYLKKALLTLETEILFSDFSNKITDPNYHLLRKHRVEELIPLSEKILLKFEHLWGKTSPEHMSDVQFVRNTIGRIKNQLNK